MKWLTTAVLSIFFFIAASGQYYDLGQDPASTRWRIIDTEHFKLVYPTLIEQPAQRLMNTLMHTRDAVSSSLNWDMQKIHVLLHNQTATPNAFAMWTPQRSEFFTTPPQASYGQDWYEQLAIHEIRHMVQMDHLNQDFTKAMTFISGQHATTLVMFLFMPQWLMEGDAVAMETALSHTGRGRVPYFSMKMKAQVTGQGVFPFNKALMGSFNDYVPDQYQFGYHFVANARRMYGHEVIGRPLSLAARKPYWLNPLSRGINEISGMKVQELYQHIWDSLAALWRYEESMTRFTSHKVIASGSSENYVHYRLPVWLNDSTLLVEKTGRDILPGLYTVAISGEEKKLATTGFYTSDLIFSNISAGSQHMANNSPGAFSMESLSLCQGKALWAGQQVDPRWGQRNYSVLKIMELTSRHIKNISNRSRYFSPVWIPGSEQILAVEADEQSRYKLVLIDQITGEEIKTYQHPDNWFFTYPSVSEDAMKAYAVAIAAGGKALVSVDLESGNFELLLPFSHHEISRPRPVNDFLLFNAGYTGTDNIFALHTGSGQIYQVTSSRYGAVDAAVSPHQDQIAYSDYSQGGYRLVVAPFQPTDWTLFNIESAQINSLAEILGEQEAGVVESSEIPDSVFASRPYSRLAHLFRIHSWAPLGIDLHAGSFKPGFSVMSQNLLSTSFMIAGWDFSRNLTNSRFFINYSYRGWYPVIDLHLSSGYEVLYPDEVTTLRRWRDEARLKVSLPLKFTHQAFAQRIEPFLSLSGSRVSRTDDGSGGQSRYAMLGAGMVAENRIRQAEKDMLPRWYQRMHIYFDAGQGFDSEPFVTGMFDYAAAAQLSLGFPGLSQHHHLLVTTVARIAQGEGQWRDHDLFYPRGYWPQPSDSLVTWSVGYLLPLAYPDWSFGSLAYLKRIRAQLFYDQASGSYLEKQVRMQSFGLELSGDFHLFRFFLPLEIGIQSAWLPIQNKPSFRLLLSLGSAGY